MILHGVDSYEDLADAFQGYGPPDYKQRLRPGFPTKDELLAAFVKGLDDYESSCILYYRRDGKLWEAEFSHCSCYGYGDVSSGDWPTEPITPAYLLMRKAPSYELGDDFFPGQAGLVKWDRFLELYAESA